MAGKSSIRMDRVVPPAPRQRSVFLSLIVLALGLWAVGFSMFLVDLNFEMTPPTRVDDYGVAVFTGGPNRLVTGMEVLTAGQGQRLLISGVNEATSREAVRAHVSDPDNLFECCVDLDYVSSNTIQNAAQSILWAQGHEYEGILVVTSYYHMPRALLELRQVNQGIHIYAHRVYPDNHEENNWWHPRRFRTLSIEYAKYEVALMRIRLANLFD